MFNIKLRLGRLGVVALLVLAALPTQAGLPGLQRHHRA